MNFTKLFVNQDDCNIFFTHTIFFLICDSKCCCTTLKISNPHIYFSLFPSSHVSFRQNAFPSLSLHKFQFDFLYDTLWNFVLIFFLFSHVWSHQYPQFWHMIQYLIHLVLVSMVIFFHFLQLLYPKISFLILLACMFHIWILMPAW